MDTYVLLAELSFHGNDIYGFSGEPCFGFFAAHEDHFQIREIRKLLFLMDWNH